MACCTVVIFSASSSGISVSNSSSSAITSSTVSSESAPRSSTNDDSFLISASLTPNCSATIFLTRCSTFSMLVPPCWGPWIANRWILPLSHVHPAVHVHRGPRDIRSNGTGQKGHRVGDVLGRPQPAQWNPAEQRLALCVRQAAGHVGVDEARRDAIDRNVAAADFLRQGLGKSDQRSLGRRIIDLSGVA